MKDRDRSGLYGRRLFSIAIGAVFFLNAGLSLAETGAGWRNPLGCDRDSSSDGTLPAAESWARSDAAFDLYNGLAYLGVAAGVTLGGQPTSRWSGVNALDGGARNGLRLNSVGQRRDANLASDVALGLSVAALPILSIASHQSRTRDCAETLDMTTDYIESLGLTLMITQSIKLASGRTRPYTRDCAPRDASCSDEDRFQSFVSGHASLAATGAGLTCAFSIKREAWGSSLAAKAAPCGIGIATALTAGTLRVAADRHWITDVLVGFAIGATVGYFDTWGPFDLLKFKREDAKGNTSMLGVVTPTVIDGRFGAQLVMIF